ncbi:MAG TPA: hypothetical protein VNZ57_00215 [Longimicrobiales bacterium]|nr:hypothetical protein [Longimicrobiales bacterium]
MLQRRPPPFPAHQPVCFRVTVHGSVFGDRTRHLERIVEGDELYLIPGPPVDDEPGVWVHLPGGDLVGHLPPEIETWLAPWMLKGGRVTARALKVSGREVPSWRRLVLEVTCVA